MVINNHVCFIFKYGILSTDAQLTAGQMTAMGITTQRGTFINWSRKTGKPFHKFITWKDLRADKLVKQWNASYVWKVYVLLFREFSNL